METMNVKTYVLCRDANGSAAIFEMDVCLPRSSYDLGYHYDIAMKSAEAEGYESPMQAFDEHEPAARVLGDRPSVVLVWLGEGGVEELIADFPLRYVVVSTDTEYAEEDCLEDCLHVINTGTDTHEVFCHTGIGTVNHHEAGFVWNQVRRLAEPELWQPVDNGELEKLSAELATALGDMNLNEAERVKELDRLQDAIVKHRKRYQKMVGPGAALEAPTS